jgi:hypothetical protein
MERWMSDNGGSDNPQRQSPPLAAEVIDYANPLHLREDRLKDHRRRRTTTPGGQILLAAATGTFFIGLPINLEWIFYAMYGWLVWAVAMLMLVSAVLASRRTSTPIAGPYGWRGWVITLFIATAVLGTRFDRCPHATYVWFGPVPVTFGDACNNPRVYSNVLERLLFDRL